MYKAAVRAPGLLCVLLVACGGSGAAPAPDAEPWSPPDAAATPDAAPIVPDELPLAGFGDLSGDCDVLDDEILAPGPALFESEIDFERAFGEADAALLTEGGQEILGDGNAGGSSLDSEIFAFELLARCELAVLLKTETEVSYEGEGKMTDLLVEVDGEKLGVSVTRAVAFPFDDPYSVEQAGALLDDKLADILESTGHVSESDRWRKQILAVLAYGPGHADSLTAALDGIDPDVRADTVVWILVTHGADHFIYCSGPCTGAP